MVKLAEIAYLEGRFDEAVGTLQKATHLIKKPIVWYQCAKSIFKCLNKLNKPASQEKFLADLSRLVAEPMEEKLTQPATFYELKSISTLLCLKFQFKGLRTEFSEEGFNRLKALFKELRGNLRRMFRMDQLQETCRLYQKMLTYAERLNSASTLRLCRWLVQVGLQVDELVKASLKYALATPDRSEFLCNPLAVEGCKLRVLLARAHCLFG